MKHFGLAFIFFCVSTAFFGGEGFFWKDEKGNRAPNTESRSAVSGFGGWLVVTFDNDWRAKWETPSNTVPHFNEAKIIGRGKHIFILSFFANPKLDDGGAANVICDIDVVRPDGSSSIHQTDTVCFRGELKGTPSNVYLSAPVLDFVGDPTDLAGKWLVRVTLKDTERHVSLPLKTSFVLQ